MKKNDLEGHLQEILEKVKKVVEENDKQTISTLTSYIHVSEDLIKYYQITEGEDDIAEKAYKKMKEAEDKALRLSRTNHIAASPFDLREILNSFIASLKELSGTNLSKE